LTILYYLSIYQINNIPSSLILILLHFHSVWGVLAPSNPNIFTFSEPIPSPPSTFTNFRPMHRLSKGAQRVPNHWGENGPNVISSLTGPNYNAVINNATTTMGTTI
jgi:hypothetical protein